MGCLDYKRILDTNLSPYQYFNMDPQVNTTRQLVRNIQCHALSPYFTKVSQKQALGYIQTCLSNPQHPQLFSQMIGLDCEMINTNIGQQVVKIVFVNPHAHIQYLQWFNIKEGTIVVDYLTQITGIDQQIFQKNAGHKQEYQISDKQIIQKLIKGKIIVGHDLANDLRMLQIQHQAFIDTVALIPHPFGLPLKTKLKYLAIEYLKKPIQWGAHDPIEDALAALQIAQTHIKDGRGTIEIQPFPKKNYQNCFDILLDAELDPSKVLFFVLRGSKALGIQVNTPNYKSDFDYIVVYDTQSKLDGRLIKLPDIDISFFDKGSFYDHMAGSDISYLEAYFLPKQFMYINKLQFPNISLFDLRASLGFHLNKSRMKQKRIMNELKQKPGMQWKMLKTVHLRIRFIDNFIQVKQQFDRIEQEEKERNLMNGNEKKIFHIDVRRMNYLWDQIRIEFEKTNNYQKMMKKLQRIEKQKMTYARKIFQSAKRLKKQGEKMQREVRPKKNGHKTIINHQLNEDIQINPIHQKLEVVQFLRQEGVLAIQDLKVSWNRHRRHSNLIELRYLQSASFKNPITRQCRGIIVDEERNYQVVALPYYKFFDYNDKKNSQLDKFDWESAKVYEKKDGSLAFMYFYAGQWEIASSSVPDGDNKYCFARKQTTIQFRKQFWNIFNCLGYKIPSEEDQHKTFIFELMSKNHIIVVKRQKSQLCLHGVRDMRTLEEEDHLPYQQKYRWNVTRPLDIKKQDINIKYLVQKAEQKNPLEFEGYVVCDKNWTRLKIKNSGYVRVNWLGQLNQGFNKDPKKYIVIEIILSGQAESFIEYCPEWAGLIKQYLTKIGKMNEDMLKFYEQIKELPKKQFGMHVSKFDKYTQTMLFALKNNFNQHNGKLQYLMTPKNFYSFISTYEGIKIKQ